MKNLIAVFVVVSTLLLSCLSVWAGDIPEALSYEDDAKVFIGTLLNCFDSPMGSQDVTVLPTFKIKGDVEIGANDTYEGCYFPNQEPKIGAEYFFGWLSNTEVYAYEIKSRTEDNITIQITDEFAGRIQDYLNEGLYEKSEVARVNVGRQISLTEYMGTDKAYVEKVTFSLNGKEYDVNVDEFFKFSDSTLITDVKDRVLKRMGSDDWDEDILYIRFTLKDGRNGGGFAGVTRFCEVDRYNPMMGRLPCCDFTMSWEDLAKLYTFFPDDVQRELYAKNGAEAVAPKATPIVFSVLVGAVIGGGIGGAVGVIIARKKKK